MPIPTQPQHRPSEIPEASGSRDDSLAEPSDPAPKKKYARQMTEKRREQNRRAQKTYRDRMRQKIEELEQQVEKTGQGEAIAADRVQDATHTCTQPSASKALSAPVDEDVEEIDQQPQSSTSESTPSKGITFDYNDMFAAAGDISLPSGSLFELSVAPSPQPEPPSLTRSLASTAPSFTNTPYQSSSSSTSATSPHHVFFPDDTSLDHIPMHGIWTMPHRPMHKTYNPPPTSPSVARDTLRALAHYIPGSLTEETDYMIADLKSRLQHSLCLAEPPHTSRNLPNPQLPSLYLNHISLPEDLSLTAYLSISLSIGISRLAYLNDHPSPFPSYLPPSTPSPTSCLHYVTYPHTAEESSMAFSHIKPDLRPVPAQLEHPHPGYLDTIVFRAFRERAVLASAAGELDHMELFLDLLHGGLVCWGGTQPQPVASPEGSESYEIGAGRKRRRGADGLYLETDGGVGIGWNGRRTRDMRDCVPWSARSWEARRWFLRKWSWLCGTEEDEKKDWKRRGNGEMGLWEGSKFWWRLRGEEEGVEIDDVIGGFNGNALAEGRIGSGGTSKGNEYDEDWKWIQGDLDPEAMVLGAAGFRYAMSMLAGEHGM